MLDNVPLKQVIQQFDAKHGADGIFIDRVIYYSDGAWRENAPFGVLAEPPEDLWERSKLQLKYWEARLSRTTDEFKEKKLYLQRWGKSAIGELDTRNPRSPPSDEDIEQLRELRETVLGLQQKVATAREAVHRNRPEELKRREEFAKQNRQRYETVLEDISDITI